MKGGQKTHKARTANTNMIQLATTTATNRGARGAEGTRYGTPYGYGGDWLPCDRDPRNDSFDNQHDLARQLHDVRRSALRTSVGLPDQTDGRIPVNDLEVDRDPTAVTRDRKDGRHASPGERRATSHHTVLR